MNIENVSKILGELGFGYFAVRGLTQSELINVLNIQKPKSVDYKTAFKYIFSGIDNHRFDIEADFIDFKIQVSCVFNDWIYLKCNYFDKEYIINKLNTLNTKEANYYYVDSCVDGCEWVISENRKTIRVFDYSMSEIQKNEGVPISSLEQKFIKQIENNSSQTEFIEYVCTSIIQNTGNHYENLKNYKEKISDFIIGYIRAKNEYKTICQQRV
ncbi:hypothetical protein [Winogradskyella forsetii]|uniref:hypothetical protein n=1 Tax=Winogradskyella forsetii TaxID=2686077 RepID=UPI0015C11041|nr:hypothetical protein [Winogradskyella forsetii]